MSTVTKTSGHISEPLQLDLLGGLTACDVIGRGHTQTQLGLLDGPTAGDSPAKVKGRKDAAANLAIQGRYLAWKAWRNGTIPNPKIDANEQPDYWAGYAARLHEAGRTVSGGE